MALHFCSFSSGSSGNCYLVKTEQTALLVDAGISGKKIWNGLAQTDTPRENLKGLLITHEHTDHTKSIGTLLRKEKGLALYASTKTMDIVADTVQEESRKNVSIHEEFWIGDIKVKAFPLSHDAAEPVGYSFSSEDRQVSIVTDTGCVTDPIFEEACKADLLVLEANHDVDMLRIGRYPWFLKQRVLGEQGHLSNETAGELLTKLLKEDKRKRNVLLAHLSRENNFPEMAFQTIKNVLEEQNYYIGKQIQLDTLRRDELSPLYVV